MKKALLIAIQSFDEENVTKLDGCINDIILWRDVLLNYGYKDENVILLSNISKKTGENALKDFVSDLKEGDSGCFIFSGHGVLTPINPAEYKYNEGLLFTDTHLADFEIFKILKENLNPNSKLFLIFDCCFAKGFEDPVALRFKKGATSKAVNPYEIDEDWIKSSDTSNLEKLYNLNSEIILISAVDSQFNEAYERKFQQTTYGVLSYYSKLVLFNKKYTIADYIETVNSEIVENEIESKIKGQQIDVSCHPKKSTTTLDFG